MNHGKEKVRVHMNVVPQMFERMENYQNDCCHPYPIILSEENLCSRKFRIVNAVVRLIASRSDGLAKICFSPNLPYG